MIALQDRSRASSPTWKADTMGCQCLLWDCFGKFWHWKLELMLTWMGLPFLQNWCIKIVDRDSSSFHGMALDISFLSQYYFLGWPPILILQCWQHWLMGYLGEDLVPSLNTWHFILAASWVDTSLWKEGLDSRGRGGGKSVALQKLTESSDCQYQHDSFTPLRSIPWWPGPGERATS